MQLGSDEQPENLKKGVLTAGHTRIALTGECPRIEASRPVIFEQNNIDRHVN